MNMFDAHIDVQALMLDDLGSQDERTARYHLASCRSCREDVASLRSLEDALRGLPPEALLEGPPPDAELLLHRTLRENRTLSGPESAGGRQRRALSFSAAAVLVALVAGVSGAVGFSLNDTPQATSPVPPAPSAATSSAAEAAGTRYASSLDAATGARLTVSVQPAAGFVRVNAAVTGIPAGERCRIIVEGLDGTQEVAGSWVVSEKGASEGAAIDGSAMIDAADVKAVLIENADGKQFASAAL
jgi:hypothetical protein